MSASTLTPSVVEVPAEGDAHWWTREQDAIRAVLVEHFGDIAGHELPESPDPDQLRAGLRSAAPALSSLTDRIRAAFDDEQACAVVVPELGVAGDPVDQQRRALFSLAAMLGNVMANHPDVSAVWDVRDRAINTDKRVRASSSRRSAGYHTDAGYLRVPPRFFLLYAAHAAECGGGVSLLRDGRLLKTQLAGTEQGREALRLLSATVPRRISPEFDGIADVAEDGLQYSAVLGEVPMWRWSARRTKENATPEVREAIETVQQLLKHGPGEFRIPVPTDGLLVIDNHVALHGRTSFTDPARNYFRIRFHDHLA